ncbi:hypothetical protein HYDPIDRAFT_176665 [Hydnomerulius pinastri MD-312]|uniref:Chitin-binding type-4 domain-containing protein n=1 Tax=Hydnomerulius pinastri MD-312 TaxID=994086 RepID=A0A0C9V8U6_9AGAM|nr:hypothetical protein HYDPIDRAFT_176665 [Hydnomerulius pinastri MD-312]
MFKLASLVFALAATGSTYAHGVVSSPPRRQPGSAFQSACGLQMYQVASSDQYGNQQNLEGVNINTHVLLQPACTLYLCRGMQFGDNTANVQHYTAGQTVDFKIDIKAPHTGVANVSVVDTTTNSVIGDTLYYIPNAYSTTSPITTNETSFSITMPDVGGKCSTAGNCVLQWWWDARPIDQTYMSCVDFTQ